MQIFDYLSKDGLLHAIQRIIEKIGKTDISTIGDGTVTGAVDTINNNTFSNKGIAADIDDINMSPVVHATNNNTAGTFPDGFTKAGYVEHIKRASAHFSQRYTELSTAPRMAVRIYINGAWSPWQKVINENDLNVAMSGTMQINFVFSGKSTSAGYYISNSVFIPKGVTFSLSDVQFIGSVGNFASQIEVVRNGNYIYLTATNSAFAGLTASCIGTVS